MSIYVDTSALYAVLDADDRNHPAAREAWAGLLQSGESLLCSNYVLVECFALVQHRLGLAAVRALQEDVVPVLSVYWVDEAVHAAGISALLTAGRERLSLVDCTSFELMRRLGLRTAFTFDEHFAEQGFACLPGWQ
ncbi:MAG: PIN domain-containing protein [Chloroflexi bacterium]|nr:PIN domain-containing protein [Chloroflexota bacterium]